jgi:AcrR family transcriptional regulator
LNQYPADPTRTQPKQGRSQATYAKILDTTSALLAEVGVEAISINTVCERAGLTPPAVYRYFKDKYAIIEALADRLMQRKSDIVERWLRQFAPQGVPTLAANVEPVLREIAGATAQEPGAIWVYRALRAIPRLAEVRLASRERATDQLTTVYAALMPHVPTAMLRIRARLSVEFTYAIDEMIAELDPADIDPVFYETGRMLESMFYFEENSRDRYATVVRGRESVRSKA